MSENERSYSKIQWFFLVIFIPVLFSIILFTVILSFLGVDIMDKAKQVSQSVPVLSSMVEDENVEEEPIDVGLFEQQLSEQTAELERLQGVIKQREEDIRKLENKILQLEKMNENTENSQDENQEELQNLAKTYESMSTKNAANIISQLPVEEAFLHLSQVSIDTRAGILAKMDSELAADLISQFTNQ
jgi:flagellar motility protein MotE (MotC chaperone)